MHRARHAGTPSTFSRSRRLARTLILLVAGVVGLAAAFWLPARNDTASASENGQAWQQPQNPPGRWHWWYGRNPWHCQHPANPPGRGPGAWPPGWPPAEPPTAEPPTAEPPTTEPPTTEPPTVEPPTAEPPTVEPPTVEPPTTEPPVTTPVPARTTAAPKATAWKPFKDYKPGQLVSFKGVEYRVREAHTSLPGWEPSKLPELFKAV